jgi:hypothetical protein
MSKKEYNHADHIAQMGKITCLYEIIIMIQKQIVKEKVILEKLGKAEKESRNAE